jgi:hypothetical protein
LYTSQAKIQNQAIHKTHLWSCVHTHSLIGLQYYKISSQNTLWGIYPYKFENKSNEYIVSEQ